MSDILYFFVPFANISCKNLSSPGKIMDAIFVVVSMIWTVIVVGAKLSLPETLPIDDLNVLISVVTNSLGFLLPLYLSNAIEKNRSGVALYESFCGDVVALAWQVAAFGDNVDGLPESEKETLESLRNDLDQSDDKPNYLILRKDLFKIMRQLPMIVKHTFREEFDYKKMKDPSLAKMMLKIRGSNISNPIEEVMFLLIMRLRRIPTSKGRESLIMKKWNDIYNSYGTNLSLIRYKEPMLFSYVLYTATTIYVLFLPFSFSEVHEWNNVWIIGLVIYFLLSLNSAGKLLQNPFISLKTKIPVFATVSGISKSTMKLIDKIEQYGRVKELQF